MGTATRGAWEDAAARVAASLGGESFGALRPQRVDADLTQDADGQDAVYFHVELPAPDPGADTWPLSEVQQLRRRAWQLVGEEGLDLIVYVVLHPHGGEEQEDDSS